MRSHVFISGKVQGVAYRAATRHQARALGVQGWVRNLPDDRVEAVFEGTPEQVEALIRWCHQGPPAAEVKSVEVIEEPAEGIEGFSILH